MFEQSSVKNSQELVIDKFAKKNSPTLKQSQQLEIYSHLQQQRYAPPASACFELKPVIRMDSTLEPIIRSLALVRTCPPALKSRSQIASVAGTAATEATKGKRG
mmetsp:Transcript_54976/g.115041  ORF Transcript_54976/g.115041 Transcript_54976/m.115041 type:complete len:104 (-) Transcript_54976:391-702(-)